MWVYGSYVRTSVIDPYTLTSRRFSGNSDYYFEGSYRQDLGRFAYGINFDGGTPSTIYRQNELDRFVSDIPYVSVFAEYRPRPTTTITIGIENLTRSVANRDRTFYAPDRRNPVANAYEIRERNRNLVPYISVKHSFG